MRPEGPIPPKYVPPKPTRSSPCTPRIPLVGGTAMHEFESIPEKFLCYICGESKPIDCFYKDRTRKWGVGHDCRECTKDKRRINKQIQSAEARRERVALGRDANYNQRTIEWINKLKSVPCADCKQTFNPVCMDFDHRDPATKLFSIAQWRAGWSPQEIVDEIGKCDIICSNCHRLRTWATPRNPTVLPRAEITEDDT